MEEHLVPQGGNNLNHDGASYSSGGPIKGVREALTAVRGPDGSNTMVSEKAGKPILSGLMAADPSLEKGCHWAQKPCPVVGDKSCCASRLVYSLT